jgi:hypothetical protein
MAARLRVSAGFTYFTVTKSANTDAEGAAWFFKHATACCANETGGKGERERLPASARQLIRFTGTKVQILTQKALPACCAKETCGLMR